MVYYGGALTKIIDRQDKIACAPGCEDLGQRVIFYIGLITFWSDVARDSYIGFYTYRIFDFNG